MKSLVGFAACVVATTALLLNCSDSANPAPAPVLSDGALPPIADAAVDSEAAPAGDTAVAGVTISGRVVSYQAGIANVKVTVQGKQTTTDMRGNFSLAGIAVPYTVSAVLESDQTVGIPLNGRAVTTYVGLRTLAPVLNVTAKGGLSVMPVAGTLAVDNSVVRQAGAVLDVLATGTLTSGIDTIKDPARAFSVPTYFPADVQQTTVNYFAYSWVSPTTGFPVFDPLFGAARRVALQRGTPPPPVPIALNKTTLGRLSAKFTMPAAYRQTRRFLRFVGSDQASFYDASALATLSVMVPNVSELRPQLGAVADGPDGAQILLYEPATIDGPEVTVDLPATHALIAPLAGASAIDNNAVFSWTAAAPSCLYFVTMKSGQAGSTVYNLVTNEPSAQLPELAGVQLTTGATYDWTSRCMVYQAREIDAYATLERSQFKGFVQIANRQFVAK